MLPFFDDIWANFGLCVFSFRVFVCVGFLIFSFSRFLNYTESHLIWGFCGFLQVFFFFLLPYSICFSCPYCLHFLILLVSTCSKCWLDQIHFLPYIFEHFCSLFSLSILFFVNDFFTLIPIFFWRGGKDCVNGYIHIYYIICIDCKMSLGGSPPLSEPSEWQRVEKIMCDNPLIN